MGNSTIQKGTYITLDIAMDSKRTIQEVFNQYTDPQDFSFNKTDALVELSKLEGEQLISRSQAKRLLFGLENFKYIMLDFVKVNVLGQGFADEVFRVYRLQHPDIDIKYRNANSSVEFMIKRAMIR